jgi:hypothetical protein
MYLLLWAQCKRWIPIRLMGYVHTHQGILTIEKCGSPSCDRNKVKKIGKIIEGWENLLNCKTNIHPMVRT